MLQAAGCTQEHLLFCGAGKFIIEVAALAPEQRQALMTEQQRLSEWLLRETNAQLRLALVINESGDTPQALYENSVQSLQREKLRAWAMPALQENKWQPDWLILKPLDSPCALCQRRTGSVEERDQDTGASRLVCRRCNEDLRLGRELPRTRWIALSEAAETGTRAFHLPGWNITLHHDRPPSNSQPLIQLTNSERADAENDSAAGTPHIIKRALARHIPRDADERAIEFHKLAEKAQGDQLLAVLKADADSLGTFFSRLLSGASDFAPLARFSHALDHFFGVTLDREVSKFDWELIYTVFAGGDDLLLVGPWDVLFDFAAHASALFKQKFGPQGLTISGGIAFLKPRRPIKHAVEQAEELLAQAKMRPAPRAAQPKDQFAAFGQIWKWKDHAAIAQAAKQLTSWVNSGVVERGWLQTLLRLAEWRQRKDDLGAKSIERMIAAMATAQLAYFVARNFPRRDDRNPEKQRLRQWADKLIADFDAANNVETIYLSTIVRYALTATRTVSAED